MHKEDGFNANKNLAVDLFSGIRSQFLIDNAQTVAEQSPNQLAVSVIGGAHYQTLKYRALETGEVNVIFIRPTEYTGPLPGEIEEE
ncbi:MAG: hypothetical protein H7A33_04060 [Deltaproteobacteria bacterium]|nr:hypothetical protein [Deltaproteobacteria bacterium]